MPDTATTNLIQEAFKAGFKAGFDSTSESWNAELSSAQTDEEFAIEQERALRAFMDTVGHA